jgi:REP element-mobilizing transposase RayT
VRRVYFDFIVENLNHCVAKKGMEIYAWCIMPSHMHLVFKSNIKKPDELIADFKSYTSKNIVPLISGNMEKAGGNGCLMLSEKPVQLIPTIPTINFGNRIIIL